MIKIENYQLKKEDFFTSDQLHTHILSLNLPHIQYIKTDYLRDRKNGIIELRGWRNRYEKIDLSQVKILVTGHSDLGIDESYMDILNMPSLITWFCTNKLFSHPKLKSIPLGITNQFEPASLGRHRIIGNTDRIFSIAQELDSKFSSFAPLAYLNISQSNYPNERNEIISLFAKKEWVTYRNPEFTDQGHEHFLRNIHQHKFVFAPRGHGLDTHRLWECLYLRTIPIVKRHIGMDDFKDLPILFVDDWSEITEEYLHHVYEKMMQTEYSMSKITLPFWLNNITFEP